MQPEPQKPKAFIAPNAHETRGGLLYLLVHVFLLGPLIATLLYIFNLQLTGAAFNVIYMLTSALVLSLLMRQYLKRSFAHFRERSANLLFILLIGFAMRILLFIPVDLLFRLLLPEFVLTPNTEAVLGLAGQGLLLTAFLVVILAPIAEELLFRGVIFAPLRKKSRVLAYAVSTLLFAFLHVHLHLFPGFSPALLLMLLPYIPAGLALAWVYEKNGSIWATILLHSLMNLIALPFALSLI